jgi:hypothetical protein
MHFDAGAKQVDPEFQAGGSSSMELALKQVTAASTLVSFLALSASAINTWIPMAYNAFKSIKPTAVHNTATIPRMRTGLSASDLSSMAAPDAGAAMLVSATGDSMDVERTSKKRALDGSGSAAAPSSKRGRTEQEEFEAAKADEKARREQEKLEREGKVPEPVHVEFTGAPDYGAPSAADDEPSFISASNVSAFGAASTFNAGQQNLLLQWAKTIPDSQKVGRLARAGDLYGYAKDKADAIVTLLGDKMKTEGISEELFTRYSTLQSMFRSDSGPALYLYLTGSDSLTGSTVISKASNMLKTLDSAVFVKPELRSQWAAISELGQMEILAASTKNGKLDPALFALQLDAYTGGGRTLRV